MARAWKGGRRNEASPAVPPHRPTLLVDSFTRFTIRSVLITRPIHSHISILSAALILITL